MEKTKYKICAFSSFIFWCCNSPSHLCVSVTQQKGKVQQIMRLSIFLIFCHFQSFFFLGQSKTNIHRLLLSIQSQMYPTFDISVRFFGIDWPHVFRISQSLIQRVEQLSETLLGTKTEIPPTQGNYMLWI